MLENISDGNLKNNTENFYCSRTFISFVVSLWLFIFPRISHALSRLQNNDDALGSRVSQFIGDPFVWGHYPKEIKSTRTFVPRDYQNKCSSFSRIQIRYKGLSYMALIASKTCIYIKINSHCLILNISTGFIEDWIQFSQI